MCFSTVSQRGRFRFRLLNTAPAVPVLCSVPAKMVLSVPVRLLGHPAKWGRFVIFHRALPASIWGHCSQILASTSALGHTKGGVTMTLFVLCFFLFLQNLGSLGHRNSEDCSRASTRKFCPKRGPRKSHEKATKKPRKSHEKGPNTVFLDRRGPRKSHGKATKK